MDDSNFCSSCGRKLEAGMQFCPQCGAVVSGSEADQRTKEMMGEYREIMTENRRLWLLMLLGVYSIPVIVSAIIILVDAGNLASAVFGNDNFQNWIHSHDLHYTESDIKNYITIAGATGLVSGICVFVSFILTYKRTLWIVAVATCILGAVFCFWSVFGIIIGFLVSWLIIGSKDLYVNDPKMAGTQSEE
ncbi:MAG: zinc-ribbon domain-containing protein [Candidatus Methanomethylophilaceae archaeon]|nr:zinc-ribbon domain-containing protein [Candidatus Methanomethylophilaceae archaeon]